jgi:AraC-like DNA-binding protein
MSEFSKFFLLIPHSMDHRISPKIRRALTYIHTDYALNVTLSDMGSRIGIHPHYLCRKFKKELGIGFHNYLLRYRVQRASVLLVSSCKSIKEIGYDVGFSCSEVFSKAFKKLMGCSPQVYRTRSLAVGDGPYVTVVPVVPAQLLPSKENPVSPSPRFFQTVFDVKK